MEIEIYRENTTNEFNACHFIDCIGLDCRMCPLNDLLGDTRYEFKEVEKLLLEDESIELIYETQKEN